MMRGFTESTQPVFIRVNAAGLPTTEVQVDGVAAEATDYGILATIANVRYFVPWDKVLYVRQVQIVADPGVPPTQTPPGSTAPVPPPPPPPARP